MTAAAGGSQTTRFERFTFQASGFAGGIDKKFRIKCKEMNTWLRKIRNYRKTKEWWLVLCAKLRGHYQYYGVSGNMRSLNQFYNLVERMTLKWLNRRSQRQSFNWEAFRRYREHYPLPQPRIVHNFYPVAH